MKLDVHITTCHRRNVKCRPRFKNHNKPEWNVKEWTHEERIKITKISVISIVNFCLKLKKFGHEINLTLLDDGSDIPEAIEILNSLPIRLVRYPARGSSAGINDHIKTLESNPPDYVFHVEDDNLLFNPLNMDWLTTIDKIKKSNEDIKVFTFRSGLPVESVDKGFTGLWGPIGSKSCDETHLILFKAMGNAHHIINWNDYKKFLPLGGSTGSCESQMNNVLMKIGLNCEPQIHVHCFHSHMWKFPINNNNLNQWHKTGEGFEFGMFDMDNYLRQKLPIKSKVYSSFPEKIEELILENYDY